MEGKSEVNIWSYYNTIRYGTYLKGVNMQPKKNQLKNFVIRGIKRGDPIGSPLPNSKIP